MPRLEVVPVESRHQQKQFLQLPWEINRGDRNWIPPLRSNQKELVGYKPHPFYDENRVQTFLALKGGKPCGRVAAIVNYGHIRRFKEQLGFFGFFESIDDAEVAAGLFDAARGWLAEHDLHAFRGPTNPSLNYECGMLVEGFDTPPCFMTTHNPPYYAKLLKEYGFVKSQDLYSFWGTLDMVDSLDKKLEFVVNESRRRFDVHLRTLDTARFAQDVRTFLDIYNKSLVGTWGFVPLSEHEVEHMSRSLRHLIVPQLTVIAEVEGRPIGAVFGLLDYNPRVKQIDGRLFPFGFMRLLWNRRKIKRMRMLSTNVVPEFQKWGIGLVLHAETLPHSLEWGMKEVEFSWVLESNHLSRKTLERGGAVRTKTHRIYDYPGTPD